MSERTPLRRPKPWWPLLTAMLLLSVLVVAGAPARAARPAGDGTPTGTAIATSAPTAEPAVHPTATPTPTATSTVVPRPIIKAAPETVATSGARVRRHHRKKRRTTVRPTATATAVPKHHRRHARKRVHHEKKATPTPSPTATATPTPPISLQAEDSITPVHCNGSARPDSARPFLTPPYNGWTSIVSYFDHDMPNFSQDGLIVTANGTRAAPDAEHRATDFPAYWSAGLRQYLYYDGHNGYDYNLWYQPVYAGAAGRVIYAGLEYKDAPDHGYGYMVMIDHHHGYITLYGHFSKILVKVRQKVRRGQEIGISGNSGHSSGPHLHFTVFHNCTPTDPYGWTGDGPDPLKTYQGESSTNLWIRPPLVFNPMRGWPGISALPPTSAHRLLLLRLPGTTKGTRAFADALKRETQRALKALGRHLAGVRADVLRGAIDVRADISAERLYALPGAVSIASMDGAEDARVDVLQALARAALVTPHSRPSLSLSKSWTGYLLQWNGRTFLVGKGVRGTRIDVRLNPGSRRPIVDIVQADPTNGAYALDLGRLSPREIASLSASLTHHPRSRPVLQVRPVEAFRVGQRREPQGRDAGASLAVLLLAAAIGLAAMVAAVRGRLGWGWRRRG